MGCLIVNIMMFKNENAGNAGNIDCTAGNDGNSGEGTTGGRGEGEGEWPGGGDISEVESSGGVPENSIDGAGKAGPRDKERRVEQEQS